MKNFYIFKIIIFIFLSVLSVKIGFSQNYPRFLEHNNQITNLNSISEKSKYSLRISYIRTFVHLNSEFNSDANGIQIDNQYKKSPLVSWIFGGNIYFYKTNELIVRSFTKANIYLGTLLYFNENWYSVYAKLCGGLSMELKESDETHPALFLSLGSDFKLSNKIKFFVEPGIQLFLRNILPSGGFFDFKTGLSVNF